MKSMNEQTKKGVASCISKGFYGTATVGERGQFVIPAEARSELGIQPGDKLMVLRHPAYAGLMVFKIESAREFLDEFQRTLETALQQASGEDGE